MKCPVEEIEFVLIRHLATLFADVLLNTVLKAECYPRFSFQRPEKSGSQGLWVIQVQETKGKTVASLLFVFVSFVLQHETGDI